MKECHITEACEEKEVKMNHNCKMTSKLVEMHTKEKNN